MTRNNGIFLTKFHKFYSLKKCGKKSPKVLLWLGVSYPAHAGDSSGDHFTVRWCRGKEAKNCAPPSISVERLSTITATRNVLTTVFLRGTTLLGCSKISRLAVMSCWLQLAVLWNSAMKLSVLYDTALVRASFPLSLHSFLFHCFYSGFPHPFLLFSYSYAPLPLILLFFSPLRHPYLQNYMVSNPQS